jgi:hypothetical protein
MEINYYYDVFIIRSEDLPELNLRKVITKVGVKRHGVDEWGNTGVHNEIIELPISELNVNSFIPITTLTKDDFKGWAIAKMTPEKVARADEIVRQQILKKRNRPRPVV